MKFNKLTAHSISKVYWPNIRV